MARKLQGFVLQNWIQRKQTGKYWFDSFMKRNPKFTIRKPEATRLGRVTTFSKYNVDRFFEQLRTILMRIKVNFMFVWNMDESGLTTV